MNNGSWRREYDYHASVGRGNTPRGYNIIKSPFSVYVEKCGTHRGVNLEQGIVNAIDRVERPSLLDLGCGVGRGLNLPSYIKHKINRVGITAAEFRSDPQILLDRLSGKEIALGDAHHLTKYFPSNQFDVVMSFFAMEYLNQDVALPELVQVMAPGGIAFLHGGDYYRARDVKGIGNLEHGSNGITFAKE